MAKKELQSTKDNRKLAADTQKMYLFLDFLRKSKGNVSDACDLMQLDRADYLTWLNTDKQFRFQVMLIIESLGDKVEAKLFEEIENNNIAAIIFYCKTKLKHRGYTENVKESNTGGGQTKINVSVVVPKKPEDIEEIAESIEEIKNGDT